MFNHSVIGRYAAALAIAGAAVMPIVARADISADADVDEQLVSGSVAADGGVERNVMPPQQDVSEKSALIPVPAPRGYDPARRCGNIAPAADDPCAYASRMRVSAETADIRR